jgi:hypothetical protein
MTAQDVATAQGALEAAEPAVERDYTSAVYGSLLVTTLIAVQWWHDASAVFLGLSLVVSVGVFWLAHVWSTIVDRRVHGPIDRAQIVGIGRHEAPMLTAALVPALLMGLAVFEFATVDQAIALALAASIIQLFLWGLAVGRAAHTSWVVALVIAMVDCALGLAVVVLKVVIIH